MVPIAPGLPTLSDATPPQSMGARRKPITRRLWGRGEVRAAYLLLVPVLALFGFAVVYPVIDTVRLSFFDIRGLGGAKFFGFNNYLLLWADPNFRHAAVTTIAWTLVSTVLSVGIGWFVAVLCAYAPRETLVARFMIFAAFGVSEAVTGFIWLGIYRPDAGGLLNSVLAAIGLPALAHPWLGDSNTALWALIVAYAWGQVGLPLIVIFASAQAIPHALLEAAHVDGATPGAIMRNIIAPLSMPGVRIAVFINLLGSLRAFDTIYILTNGGPVRSTETIGFFMYRETFTQYKLGYGAASTVILLIAVLVVSVPAIVQRTSEAR